MRRSDAFCSGRIGVDVFYESKHFVAVYDIAPVIEGHSLIIPKRHVLDILELKPPEAEDLHSILHKVVPVLTKRYGDGKSYNLIVQVGKNAGMSVPHLHMHVIPRKFSDLYHGSNTIYIDIDRRERKKIRKEHVRREVEALRRIFRYRLAQR